MTVITKHASKRLKERLGLSRKSQERYVKKVLNKGIKRTSLTGSVRRYLDCIYNNKDDQLDRHIVIYGLFIFIFYNDILITVLDVIPIHRKAVLQLIKGKFSIKNKM